MFDSRKIAISRLPCPFLPLLAWCSPWSRELWFGTQFLFAQIKDVHKYVSESYIICFQKITWFVSATLKQEISHSGGASQLHAIERTPSTFAYEKLD